MLIFVVHQLIPFARKALTLYVDCTFKICRYVKGRMQVLCIFYKHTNEGEVKKSMGAPIAFAILENKQMATYELAFERIMS